MAVTEVRKLEMVNGEASTGSSVSGTKGKARVPYLVKCDAQPAYLDDLKTASDGTRSVPNTGDPYRPLDLRLLTSKTVKPKQDGAKGLDFIVECNYDEVDPGWNENPLLRKDTIKFSGNKETESIFMSVESTPKPITTPAGEPFEKLPTHTTGAFKLVIDGYRALSQLSTLSAAMKASLKPNALNDGAVTIRSILFDDQTLKMVNGGLEIVVENGVQCLKLHWELEPADDWDLKIDARGFWEKDASSGKLRRIAKGDPPVPVTKPWPLDSLGGALSNATDEPAHLTFPIQPKNDFSVYSWTGSL